MLTRPFLLTILLFILKSLCAQTPLDSVDLAYQEIANRSEVPGFGIAIVDEGGILFESGYGFADIEAQRPYTAHTIQNIGSVSKTFIGIALQQAVEKGLLDWDQPINNYLDFEVVHPRFPDQAILLRHLASHTAGINDGKMYEKAYSLTAGFGYEKGELPKGDYREFKAYAQNSPMQLGQYCRHFLTPGGRWYRKRNFTKFAPGDRYEYSNVGAGLAAHILEKATGVSFPDWTQKHILKPLGMDNSGWSFDAVNMDTHASLYFGNDKPIPRYTLATYPDGGMLTSVHQLGLYLSSAIRGYEEGNALLSHAGYQLIMSSKVKSEDDSESYGYFWEQMDPDYIGHSGGDPGIVTLMYFDKEAGYGAIIFMNGHPDTGEFINELIATALRYGKRLSAVK